ncbi:MAG: hypothetical protein Q9183_005171, partial [Haloplaca sp. 2 TL-2023]
KLIFNIPSKLGHVFNFEPCKYQGPVRYCLWQTFGTIFNGYGDGNGQIYNQQFQQIGEDQPSDYHEWKVIQVTNATTGKADDLALFTTYGPVRRDLSAFGVPNENNQGWVTDCHARVLNLRTRKVLFDWSALDHVPLSEGQVMPTGAINGFTSQFSWDYL